MKTCKYPNCDKWTDSEYLVPVCDEHEDIANFIIKLIEEHTKRLEK